jgi:hypothetical protein
MRRIKLGEKFRISKLSRREEENEHEREMGEREECGKVLIDHPER